MTNSYTETQVWGIDTETCEGPPISLQLYTEDGRKRSLIFQVTEKTVLDVFIKQIDALPSHSHHVMYAHNLKFDLVSLLWPKLPDLVAKNGFTFTVGNWEVDGVHGSPSFARFTNKRNRTVVHVLDSFLWFQTSLDKAAQLVCPDLRKLKAPTGLGTKHFSVKDKSFREYAMRDAEVSYHLGKVIQSFHIEFDISQSLTLAHMASKIFRKHFLKRSLQQPSVEVITAAQAGYHGGKNNVIPESAPAWHINVASLDISSAYPYAMSQLPSFSDRSLYKRARVKLSDRRSYNNGVANLGVYLVSGKASDCIWPSLFDRSFSAIRGKFADVWVSGFDLNAALEYDEVKLTAIKGYYYDEKKDRNASPFKAYVDEFYSRKESATDPVRRYMYKTILNSLYGKFIQTTATDEIIDGDRVYNAGAMYHPFIASSITGHTRRYIHDIEHSFQAIHTATDGVFAPNVRKLDGLVRNFNAANKCQDGLGSVKVEAVGDLLLLRNKLYILYGEKGIRSQYFKGKTITKYALHGFQSSVYELEKLVASNRRKYQTNRPNQLRESLKSKGTKTPNQFVKRDMVLKVGRISIAK